MTWKRGVSCGLFCIIFPLNTFCQVRRPMVIGRNSGSITLEHGQRVRVFGFANKLNEEPGLPGATIEARVGDSLEVNFWNVSQGDPHDIQITGIAPQKQNEPHEAYTDNSIHHMEHGYYSFVAKQAGTYIYYCPVNYPFDVQAGMFGIMIVRPGKENNAGQKHIAKELLWCGYELDTVWHTDEIMDEEQGVNLKMTKNLTYRPQYFLINGKTNGQLTEDAIMLRANCNTTILIRLANTGLTKHIVTFPKEMELNILTKNAQKPAIASPSNTLLLKPMETYEVLVSCKEMYNGFVTYAFINDGQDAPIQVQKIPVLITN
jgi:FtsP/CotA-like multicopper oxidase with cupredoxin domain